MFRKLLVVIALFVWPTEILADHRYGHYGSSSPLSRELETQGEAIRELERQQEQQRRIQQQEEMWRNMQREAEDARRRHDEQMRRQREW